MVSYRKAFEVASVAIRERARLKGAKFVEGAARLAALAAIQQNDMRGFVRAMSDVLTDCEALPGQSQWGDPIV